MSKWISVDDQPPEDNAQVIICYSSSSGNYCGQMIASYYWGRFFNKGSYALKGVTHWMKLPEPPKV